MKQSPWILVIFIAIGVVGLALVAFGFWLLVQSNQLGQALAVPVPQNQPSPGETSGMIIITATLDNSGSDSHTPVISSEMPQAGNPEPLPSNEISPTPTPLIPWNPCPGSYLSHLRPGYRASVSLQPPLPNNVREKPDPSSRFLFAIQPGELVDIIVGPECSSGWVWWQIQTTTGKSGWTSEGDGKDYWLVPVN